MMDDSSQSFKRLLQRAAHLYDDQLRYQAQPLFTEYQKQHLKASPAQLQTLVDQHFQCWNMVARSLTEGVQRAILKSSETFEAMKQKGQVQDFMKTHHSLNKENEKAFTKVLERHWIEKSFPKSSEHKVSDLLKETARTIEKSFPRTTTLSQSRGKQSELEP